MITTPGGIIEISGTFFSEHRSELMYMIVNIAKKEISEQPLERLMHIEDERDETVITTTGILIARRIRDALLNAYEGELNYNYDVDNVIRVYWKR